jgi:hypothetical protein
MTPLPLPVLFGTLGTLLVSGIYFAWVRPPHAQPSAQK